MKYLLSVLFSLIASAAFAACPAGSNCTQYDGTVPYAVQGGSSTRTPAKRANDQGINILEFGADPTGIADSTAAIQAAIDYAFTHNNAGGTVAAGSGVNSVFCPAGNYMISYPIFFDLPNNMRGSAPAYNAGTTYALDAVVTYNGIPWISLSNGNVGHTPTTGTGAATFWTPTTVSVASFSFGATLRGVPGLTVGSGNRSAACQFNLTYNNAPGLWSAPGNGVEIANVSVNGPNISGGPGHRCGLPSTGYGIGIPGGGGGANRTKLTNVGATNMYYGIVVGANVGGGPLGAENKIEDPFVSNSCYGISFLSLQNYINHIFGATVCGTTGLFANGSSQGTVVEGGNWSCEDGTNPSRSFAMSSVNTTASGAGYVLTATLTLGGDTYMTHTCATIAECSSNVYNAFTVATTHFGVVPFELSSFNSGTGAATFTSLPQWQQVSSGGGLGDIITELNAISTIYATEMVTVFDGAGISATNIHIENASGTSSIVPTRLIYSRYSYGTNRPNVLTDIYSNTELSGVSSLSVVPTAPVLAAIYAQQTFDFINAESVDLTINSYNGLSIDYLNTTANTGARLTWHNSSSNSPPLNLRPRDFFQSRGYAFSSQYQFAGTPAFGFGYFDIPPKSFAYSTDTVTPLSDSFRTTGWQQSPAWGNRPAPWSTPCISPAQYAQLQSLPAITKTGPSTAPTFVSGTYNSGTGVVTLTLTGGTGVTAQSVTVSGATGTGSFASINGTVRGYGTNTLQYVIGTGLTMTITGATIAYNNYTYAVTYPIIFGGQQYRQCHWNMTLPAYAAGTTYAQGDLVSSGGINYYSLVNSNTGHTPASSPTFWQVFHYGLISHHLGWSYGQNLTTSNIQGLTWASRGGSFQVYIADANGWVPSIIFPGMVITLTGTGGSGCPLTTATFIITGVHRYLGYVDVINAAADLSTSASNGMAPWGTGNQCTGTTIAQPAYAFVNLD